MTTYSLAVYSALYGPIAIEKADSKKDLLNKMVDYIKQYQANAIERFIDLLRANVQKPVANADSIVDGLIDVDFIRVHNHPEEPLVFFKFNKNSPEANLEFLYRNRETGEEFVIFAKKDQRRTKMKTPE